MPDTNLSEPATPQSDARFATTHWSVVLKASQPDRTGYCQALETLCRTYWYPLYTYLRRKGYSTHQAEDFTQGFFATLLEKHRLECADPARGRFRSFLLVSLKHFVSDETERVQARKRGGDRHVFSLDVCEGERRYMLEPADDLSPEGVFERAWALTVLQEALTRVKTELVEAGKRDLFEYLKCYLQADEDAGSYAQTAAKLGMTEGAIRVAVHRLRQRYGQLVRREIAQTVASPDQVEEELQQLFGALSR